MCFRPAEVAVNKCEACGTVNKPIAKECVKCGAPLTFKKVDFDADQAALDASNIAAKAPAPPSPIGAPKPPAPPTA